MAGRCARRSATTAGRSAVLVVLAVAGILGSGCASTTGPSTSVDTMAPGWEATIKIQWKAVQESGGTRRITGSVENLSPNMYRVRILIKALDASGAVVARRVQQLFGELPPFERDHFEVLGLPAAERYEVTVYSLEPVPGLEG